ncbi:MAG: YceI family protein [Planctomycetota bacterium]
MRAISLLLPVLVFAGFQPGEAQEARDASTETSERYTIDPNHSAVVFRIKHIGVSYVYGRFNEMRGSFVLDPKNPESCEIGVRIPVKSVDTARAGRDKHLRSPDFFNAKEFPEIAFKSRKVEKLEGDRYEVTGDLSLLGKTRSLTAEAEFVGKGTTQRFGTRAGFSCEFTIKRSDFGMNFMVKNKMVGDEVKIFIGVEGTLKK